MVGCWEESQAFRIWLSSLPSVLKPSVLSILLSSYLSKYIYLYTGLRLQRRLYGFWLVLFLQSGFLVGQIYLISVLNNLVYHQNTQMYAETENHFLEFWVVFTVSSFVVYPVYLSIYLYIHLSKYLNIYISIYLYIYLSYIYVYIFYTLYRHFYYSL